MTLRMYKTPNGAGTPISTDASYSNPVLFESNNLGGIYETRYFLRSDDPDEVIADGILRVTDSDSIDDTDWIKFAFDLSGSPGSFVSELAFNIEAGQELAVWVRGNVPEANPVGTKTDITIVVQYISE